MNELNPIALALPAGPTNQAADASANLADNFDTFLTLLTRQLQNQDPLDPMDAQQFTQQLVEFTSVEQQIAQNQSLETLLALQSANARMSATDYIGRTVTASTPTSVLDQGQARWSYALPREAETVELMITDRGGRVAATLEGETGQGAQSVVWDGRDAAGNQAVDGLYDLTVVAKDGDGQRIDAPVRVVRPATGVDMSGDEVMVELGGVTVPAGSIVGVRAADGL